uniref:GlxA family transcriptional regulator n=1 Tax=Bosea sp. NBC_00436 TaxID=2969620 RepID=A0A9E7ZXC0_9HYPH
MTFDAKPGPIGPGGLMPAEGCSVATTFGFLVNDGFPLLSLASSVESLRAANTVTGKELYRWVFLTTSGLDTLSSCRMLVRPDYDSFDAVSVDVLVVCAGDSAIHFHDERVFAFLRRLARKGVRIGGLSGGTFVLARAGLMEGKRCTAHWDHVPALREQFPKLKLKQTLFEFDGPCFTCAGGNAALDMMNALIATDHGPAVARNASEWLIQTQIRQAEDHQRMSVRQRFGLFHPLLIKALDRIEATVDEPFEREALAESVGLSLRQLERLFASHLHMTIHQYVVKLRIDRAKILIRQTSLPLGEIAIASGFTNFSHFSRIYKRQIGVSPRETRQNERAPPR